jgi:hypothetical protein
VTIRLGDPIPFRCPAAYIVRSGKAISHIGDSGQINGRLGDLARLRKHLGGAEVLCVAWCTHKWPTVGIQTFPSCDSAHDYARELKKKYGEPPCPKEFAGCKNGTRLRAALVEEAGVRT